MIEDKLIEFLNNAHSTYHGIQEIKTLLEKNNFNYLKESEIWNIKPGNNYYTIRNNSSILAFKVGENLKNPHFQIISSHSDSPCFKLKDNFEVLDNNKYLKLNIEGYGGMIHYTWLDKPLTIAGKVMYENKGSIETKLLYLDEDLLIIPSVAIHQNREVNINNSFNVAKDLLPIASCGLLKANDLKEYIATSLKIKSSDILAYDLYLKNRQKAIKWGIKEEFFSSPRIDNLECAFLSCNALIESENPNNINVCVIFDNEEVGSNTYQGALSSFMKDSLTRVCESLGFDFISTMAKSFMVSADNAHGIHPNSPEKYDAHNIAYLNKGIVIKESASQSYTTDAFSRAIMKKILNTNNLPYQNFANRSDLRGGSTLGNLSNMIVSIHGVDVGLPELAMHSAYETAGLKDIVYGLESFKAFYNSCILIEDHDKISIE